MSKFMGTDGPWVALNGLSFGREVVGRKPRGGDYVVARCGGKDREHNARLIAAAPEMLEALQYALETLKDCDMDLFHNVIEVGDAAIAKALGNQ